MVLSLFGSMVCAIVFQTEVICQNEAPSRAVVGNLFLPRAIWILITSFAGHTKLST